MASRSRWAPQVMAYWLMSSRMARAAASLSSSGAAKLGNPCARLRELCSRARRVIPRITDSRKPWVRRAVVMMRGSRKASGKYKGGKGGKDGKGGKECRPSTCEPSRPSRPSRPINIHLVSPPPPFVDLHNHLVPGVDDGAESVDESLGCLAGLFEQGVRTLVSTPHLLLPRLSTDASITRELDFHRRAFDELVAAAAGRDDLPALGLGQEIWAPDAASLARAAGRADIG